jgi:hypothetical protein
MHTTNPLPCGCRASLSRDTLTAHGNWHVKHCPLHAAAADLLTALKEIRSHGDDDNLCDHEHLWGCCVHIHKVAHAAIAKAEPPTVKGE